LVGAAFKRWNMGLKDNLRELEALRQMLDASEQGAAFGREIRLARTNRGMTLDALAAATGMAKSYLSQIETGFAPPPRDDKVQRIAAALGLDAEALLARARLSKMPDGVKERIGRLREVFDSTEGVIKALLASREVPGGQTAPGLDLDALHRSGLLHHLAEWGAADGAEPKELPVRRVPIINKVSAGYPQEFTDLGYPVGVADEYVTVPAEMSDQNAFAVRVVGDSMEPKYHEGDVVIFSPAATVNSGDDCFVRFAASGVSGAGQSTFKRVFFDPEDAIRLQPINERHAPKTVRASQVAAIFRAAARYEKL
jgi:transcriptional regulator with XRE-family HTH domain